MIKYEEIAQWLYDKIMQEGYVTQAEAVDEIETRFGEEYIYINENGNPAVSPKVYAKFSKLKKENIEWDRSDFSWHKVTETEHDLKMLLNEVKFEGIQTVDVPKIGLPKIDIPDTDFKN